MIVGFIRRWNARPSRNLVAVNNWTIEHALSPAKGVRSRAWAPGLKRRHIDLRFTTTFTTPSVSFLCIHFHEASWLNSAKTCGLKMQIGLKIRLHAVWLESGAKLKRTADKEIHTWAWAFSLHYMLSFIFLVSGPLQRVCLWFLHALSRIAFSDLMAVIGSSLFGTPAFLVPQPIHLWHSASASQHNGQITIAIKLLLTTLPFHIGIHFTLPQVPVKYSEFRSCPFSRTDCRRSLDEAFSLYIVAVACLPQSPIKGISCQSHKLIFQDKKLFGQTGFKSQIVFWRYKKSQLFSHSLTEANNQLGRVCVWGHQREILSQDYFASGPNRRCGQWDHLNWENYIWKC